MLVLTWIRRGAKDSAIAMAVMLVLNTFDYNVAQANLIIRTFSDGKRDAAESFMAVSFML